MGSTNLSILEGEVVSDVCKTSSVNPRACFSVRTIFVKKDIINNKRQHQTETHDIECLDKLCDIALKNVKKGNVIVLKGKISYRKDRTCYIDCTSFSAYQKPPVVHTSDEVVLVDEQGNK